jgi:hypothetical protein
MNLYFLVKNLASQLSVFCRIGASCLYDYRWDLKNVVETGLSQGWVAASGAA